MVYAVFPHPAAKRARVEIEDLCCPVLRLDPSIGLPEHLEDVVAFQLGKAFSVLPSWSPVFRAFSNRSNICSVLTSDISAPLRSSISCKSCSFARFNSPDRSFTRSSSSPCAFWNTSSTRLRAMMSRKEPAASRVRPFFSNYGAADITKQTQ